MVSTEPIEPIHFSMPVAIEGTQTRVSKKADAPTSPQSPRDEMNPAGGQRLLPSTIPLSMPVAIEGQVPTTGRRMDDLLPPALRDVIKSYTLVPEQFRTEATEQALEQFRTEATQVAFNIERLDQNPKEALQDPEIREWVTKLCRIGWVARAQRQNPLLLPPWLKTQFLQQENIGNEAPVDPVDQQKIHDEFQTFLEKGKYNIVHDIDYRRIDPTPHEEAKRNRPKTPRQYKLYIENKNLLNALQDSSLATAFQQLRESGHLPWDVKLADTSLVVYFTREDIQSAENVKTIMDVFKSNGITPRGPVQDVNEARIISGELRVGPTLSNDQAVSGKEWLPNRPYTPDSFLQRYLNQCAYYGKSPIDIYRTSFVGLYLTPDQQKLLTDGQILQEAEAKCGYPVIPRIQPNTPQGLRL